MTTPPTTIEELQSAVRTNPRVLPRGGGTKPALSTPPGDVTALNMAGLSGVLEYEPAEFTFTALAGTRISEVQALLDQHGQYLPFDPLLVERGATLGGTVAAGVSGPGRYRFGGVRDFILGVRYVDGAGEIVRGGGKVVKNAAGFDLPKLMVGSLGQLGVLIELAFKVFPKPEAYTTLRLRCPSLDAAVQALQRAYTAPLDMDALDLAPDRDGSATLFARLGGLRNALPRRVERIRALLGGGEALEGADEAALWRDARELAWVPPGWTLVKIPLTPGRITQVETLHVTSLPVSSLRRYSAGGNVAWIASPEPPQALPETLSALGLSGLVVFGPPGQARIGVRTGETVARRVKDALDPAQRFVDV